MNADRYDLIDRYLDGAADPNEAAELLNSMAEDPTLVQDMEMSVALRSLVEEEKEEMVAPIGLYDKIVAEGVAAGLLTPAATTATGATAATGIISSVSSSSSSVTAIITAISAAVVGTLATVYFTVGPGGTDTPTVSGGGVPPRSTMTTTATPDGVPPQIAAVAPIVSNEESSDERPIERSTDTRSVDNSQVTPVDPVDEPDVPNTTETNNVVDDDVVVADNTPVEEQQLMISPMSFADNSVKINAPSHTDDAPTQQQELSTAAHDDTPHYQNAEFDLPITIRLYQRPVSGLSYDAAQGESSLGNISFEIETDLAPTHKMGAGVHRDLFPVDVLQADGGTVREPFLTWFGMHYRWEPKASLPLGLTPFAQMAVGGSSRGVMVQPAAGLMLPIGSMSIGAGVDALGLAFQSQGNWGMEYSPALRIELGYRF